MHLYQPLSAGGVTFNRLAFAIAEREGRVYHWKKWDILSDGLAGDPGVLCFGANLIVFGHANSGLTRCDMIEGCLLCLNSLGRPGEEESTKSSIACAGVSS